MSEKLLQFYKNIVKDLENKNISPKYEHKLGEMMREYIYFQRYKNDLDDKEMQKYLFLGWYIYNCLDENENENENENKNENL